VNRVPNSRNRGLVVLASYPKSGNTWVRALFSGLLHEKEGVRLDALDGTMVTHTHPLACPFPFNTLTSTEQELWHGDACRALRDHATAFTLQKTHLRLARDTTGAWIFPAEEVLAAIHIVRHPFDVAPSLASHMGLDLDRAVDFLLRSDMAVGGKKGVWIPETWGSWSENTRTWMDPAAPFPVLRVRYEDLRRDTLGTFARIVEFVGGLPDGQEDLERAVEAARFERLQEQEAESGFRERPKKAASFFRSGRSGEGWERLSAAQRERILAACAVEMEQLGYSEAAP